jgi:hypothetical protein
VVHDVALHLPALAADQLGIEAFAQGLIRAFLTFATVPAAVSISITSRMVTSFSWIRYSSRPAASSRIRVLRMRRALPSTLNARWPAPFSIQKSSPMANIRWCI